MKLKLFVVVLFLAITSVAFSQGMLKGRATVGKDPIPYVNIAIFKHGKMIGGAQSNLDGEYFINPIDTGKYDVKASYVGYKTNIINGVTISKDKITILDFKMETSSTELESVEVEYTRPLISKDVSYSSESMSSDEIMRMPSRSASSSKGERGKTGTVRGARTDGSVTYVDGVKTGKKSYRTPKGKYRKGTHKRSTPKDKSKIETVTEVATDTTTELDSIVEEPTVSLAHLLTAGEVNDFTKWILWNDINKTDLAQYATSWNLFPKNRYCVQLTNKLLNPVVDATVELKDKNNKTIWSSKSDNTGKAELWSNMFDLKIKEEESFSIEITYLGQKQVIKKAIPFHKGVNNLKLEVDCNYSNNVDVMFVVDATGSMGDEINYLKAELLDIINNVKKQDSSLIIKLGSVFYRDKGDQYVTRKSDFSSTIQQTIDFINDQDAGGGGDYEEAVDVALNEAITQCTWSSEARSRILFLVLDAPPHGDSAVIAQLQQLINTAAQKGIRIIPIMGSGISKSTEYLFRSMALATNGTYTFLTDDSGIGGPHIKPTTDTYKVELLNDMMLRLFKQYTSIPVCNKPVEFVPEELIPDTTFLTPIIDTTRTKDTTNLALNPDTTKTQVPIVEVKPTWKCYPNPTTGMLTVEINGNLVDLFITDNSGKILEKVDARNGDKTMQIDLSNYPNGIYFVRYYYGIDQSVTAKIILTR